MLTLAQASSYFDRTPAYDSTGTTVLFYCQIEPFDDSRRDSSSAHRRILSVAPGVDMPADRVIRLFDRNWLVGTSEADGMEDMHRVKFVITQAPRQMHASSLGDFLAGVSTQEVWAAAYWSKDVRQTETSSSYPQMYDVFTVVPVRARSVLWDDAEQFLVMSPRDMPSGFLSAHSLKLDRSTETVALESRVYDPIAGDYVLQTSNSTPALRVRWQSLFDYSSQMDERYQEGDVSVVLPPSAPVNTGSLLKFSDQAYQVTAVDNLSDAQVAHCRRF